MKKNYLLYLTALLLIVSSSSATLKSYFGLKTTQKPLTPTEELLAQMKTFIEEKRAEKIAKLEAKENPKKREKAEILKKRRRLDHIKIITEDNTIYLQLENSGRPLGALGYHYPFNAQELEKQLQQLLNNDIIHIQQDTQADIYKSEKIRNHPLFGILYGINDLYSAAIFLGVEKASHRRRDIRRRDARYFRRYNQGQD